MRYSFHGKVRATGQQVDGFVEAASASLAIDRLADKGIIGVYSVRPEPKPPRHAVTLGADAAKETEESRTGKGDRRLSKPIPNALPAPVASALPADAATAELLKQLNDKIAALTGKVEAMLARPQVIYQNGSGGPARNGGTARKPGRVPADVQNSTLRDIFQNNLDLRQSLEKLATTVGPPPARPSENTPREMPAKRELREPTNGSSHESGMKTRELIKQAQPAA